MATAAKKGVIPTAVAEKGDKEKEIRQFSVVNTTEELLEWNKDANIQVVFSLDGFAPLADDVVLKLRPDVQKAYYRAEGAYLARVKEAARSEDEIFRKNAIIDPIEAQAARLLKKRPRKGWHQTWVLDDEQQGYLDSGYQVVRRTDKDEAPGEETGEVWKINEGRYKNGSEHTLIQMEIREDVYKEHLEAVAAKSAGKLRDQYNNARSSVEKINSEAGKRGVKKGMSIVDRTEERPEQHNAWYQEGRH